MSQRKTIELTDARKDGLHNIGEAARLSGVSAKMIRHYEQIGLIPAVARTVANYRLYDDANLHRLRFIARARVLGFPIEHIRQLLALWNDPGRASSEVKALAQAHARELDDRIRQLQAMQRTLRHLAEHCHGDARPQCPILDELAGAESTSREIPNRQSTRAPPSERPRPLTLPHARTRDRPRR